MSGDYYRLAFLPIYYGSQYNKQGHTQAFKFVSWNIQGMKNKLSYVESELLTFNNMTLIETRLGSREMPKLRGFKVESVS